MKVSLEHIHLAKKTVKEMPSKEEKLQKAAFQSDCRTLKKLLKKGFFRRHVDVNELDADG